MAISVTATVTSDCSYTFLDSNTNSNLNETSSLGHSLALAAGTGTGEINAAVRFTGALPAAGETILSFNSLSKEAFGGTSTVDFSNVKAVLIKNGWNGPGDSGISDSNQIANMHVRATGANGFSGLFNGQSGNLKIAPNSTFSFIERFGETVSASEYEISLVDTDGSGVPFTFIAVGVSGI